MLGAALCRPQHAHSNTQAGKGRRPNSGRHIDLAVAVVMATTVPCGMAWSPSSSPATDVGSVAGWAFAANRQHVPLDRDAQGRWVHARHIHFDDELVTASIDVDWRSECSGGASPKPGRERVESRHRHGGPPLCVIAAFAFVLDFRAACQTVKPDDYSEPRDRRRTTEPRRGEEG